jgi:hypothetical protein
MQELNSENNLSKKELALEKSGASRELAYNKIVAMTKAQVMTLDKFGGEHFAEDNNAQLRASEMILKLNGDLKDTLVDNRVYNNTVNVSAAELAVFTDIVKAMNEEIKGLRNSGRQTGEIIDIAAE